MEKVELIADLYRKSEHLRVISEIQKLKENDRENLYISTIFCVSLLESKKYLQLFSHFKKHLCLIKLDLNKTLDANVLDSTYLTLVRLYLVFCFFGKAREANEDYLVLSKDNFNYQKFNTLINEKHESFFLFLYKLFLYSGVVLLTYSFVVTEFKITRYVGYVLLGIATIIYYSKSKK